MNPYSIIDSFAFGEIAIGTQTTPPVLEPGQTVSIH